MSCYYRMDWRSMVDQDKLRFLNEQEANMKLTALALAIPLTACAATQAKLETDGAIIADDVRSAAELTLCKAITIGAWVRAYGSSPEKAAAWKAICAQTVTETPAK